MLLRGFLAGSLEEVPLRRVARRHLARASVVTEVLRRVLRRGGGHRRRLEGAEKAGTRPVRRVRPHLRAP